MAEFNTNYNNPMDRPYYTGYVSGVGQAKPTLEAPIITIGELGQTVPETDPSGKFKNMVQGVQAALRGGSKNIQLVMTVAPNSPMGGRPKAYGAEVRQAMREMFVANDANLIGIEMPTSMNNLSGFDAQQGVFSESTRTKYMDEVKEAIRFASDVGQGGGIDIVSWEFQRPISAIAPEKEGFFPEEEEVLQIVDEETGRINAFRKKEVKLHLPLDPKTGKKLDVTETGLPELREWRWDDFEKQAEREHTTPEQEYIRMQLDARIKTATGWAGHYAGIAEATAERLKDAKETNKPKEVIDKLERDYAYELQLSQGQLQEAKELEERRERMKPVAEYAKAKSMESYAELGIAAMDETLNNPKVKSPIHVGPELGWPHAYGGHPKEFVELIKGARTRMVELLTNRYYTDPATKEVINDPATGKPYENGYYKPGLSKDRAQKEAEEHIQGMLDTGHLGMWLEHFQPNMRYQERVKEFNKWFMKQIDFLADSKVIGGIQAVDSAGAAHGHLPAGQGIFPVVDAVRKLKEKGFHGYIVSEGHEEERFGEGRILLKTWQAFNAPIESRYGPGVQAGNSYNNVHQNYFGRIASPRQMFGSYTPPFGEYKPWSEIPFE